MIDGKEYNTRDKILVELAWEGLTVDEMKNLKEQDIVFDKSSGSNIAKIKLETRTVNVRNEGVVEDIKKTLRQTEYYLASKTGRKSQFRKYKETDYLIKVINTNTSSKDTASNLTQIMKKVLARVYVLPTVDLENLTLESIRRSRAIEMLKHNESLDDVQEFMGKKTSCDLYWLQELALKINKMEGRIRMV